MSSRIKEQAIKVFYDIVGPMLHQSEEVNVRIASRGNYIQFELVFDSEDVYVEYIDETLVQTDEDYIESKFMNMWHNIMEGVDPE